MLYYEKGSADLNLTDDEIRAALAETLGKIGTRSRVLAIPPDFTRYHSYAGQITSMLYEYYGDRLTDVLPALGTHSPMTPQ
jgi:hypothetical protein